jgi:hypothetical protein
MGVGVLIGVVVGGVIGLCIGVGFCLMFYDNFVQEFFAHRSVFKKDPKRPKTLR